MSKIIWDGDLDDDCTARFGDLLAHCECMSDGWFTPIGEDGKLDRRERFKCELWYAAIYRGGEEVYHSGNAGGAFTNGHAARGVCEAIMQAHLPTPDARRLT